MPTPRPDPPRPVGLEPRESLHRLVGRRPDATQGERGGAAGRRAARGQGASTSTSASPASRPARSRRSTSRSRRWGGCGCRSRSTGGSTSAIMAGSPGSTRQRRSTRSAPSRSRSGAARSTSRRRRWSRAAPSTSPATAAMPASPSRHREPQGHDRARPALLGGADRAGAAARASGC